MAPELGILCSIHLSYGDAHLPYTNEAAEPQRTRDKEKSSPVWGELFDTKEVNCMWGV